MFSSFVLEQSPEYVIITCEMNTIIRLLSGLQFTMGLFPLFFGGGYFLRIIIFVNFKFKDEEI